MCVKFYLRYQKTHVKAFILMCMSAIMIDQKLEVFIFCQADESRQIIEIY